MVADRTFARLVWVLWALATSDGSVAAERAKRELRFPKGTSFVAAVALASLLPKGPTDGFAHVLEFDLGFPFPEKIAIDRRQTTNKLWHNSHTTGEKWKGAHLKKHRGRRSVKDDQRQNLLLQMEDAIKRVGFDGFSCVSRFRCELKKMPGSGSLLEDLLFVMFRTSSRNNHGRNCDQFLNRCPFSLLHAVMHSEQLSPVYM